MNLNLRAATLICSALLSLTFVSSASAATITVVPGNTDVLPGASISFDLIANFGGDLTVGGATDLMWDSAVLSFDGFAFSSALAAPIRDSFFDVIDEQSSSLFSVGFGNFAGISLPTDTIIGTISFLVIGAIGSSTDIALSDSIKWSGYLDLGGTPIDVSYAGTSVNVVPLPAGAWLILSGLLTLRFSRRRSDG